ncbi:hypothetical protein DSCA_30080 [Desulfosarcina alkanivorans]|uniref:Yip1 domain-containing protein n=1 Tax=Desulfosarcina alkanivorans TaxID=571177 RepID=A0A5K7YJN5_9BACT|nr:hypothetical protein [Desulfosarcina alkanivorans]BBO69078.1 hypothetical protein DSCA_30080 [Desulfosarcina alkanivorans]
MEAVGKFSAKGAAMHYFQDMMRILRLDGAVFDRLAATRLPMRYTMLNVSVLGVIYGMASIQFARSMLARQPDATISFNPLMILMVSISIAFFMHGGLSLFVWVFCRGIGGSPQFMPTYLNIGTAAITLWPLAPVVSALQSGVSGPGLTVGLSIAGVYAAAGIFVAVKAASGLSPVKMTLAAVATVVYVGCFLYLWL